MNTPQQFAWYLRLCWGVFLFYPLVLFAQPSNHSLTALGTMLSGSRIYLSPQAIDQTERMKSYDFSSSTSLSLAYRYQLTSSSLFQIRAEYLSEEERSLDPIGTSMLNGYDVVVLENSGLFQLPLGGTNFRLCIGGGVGLYLASRTFGVADILAEPVGNALAIDIHILLSAEYFFLEFVSLRGEVLFRDPQISVENSFPVNSVLANGIEYQLKKEPFRSIVNLNGNVYMLGIACYF